MKISVDARRFVTKDGHVHLKLGLGGLWYSLEADNLDAAKEQETDVMPEGGRECKRESRAFEELRSQLRRDAGS